jgi:hypothetical protein
MFDFIAGEKGQHDERCQFLCKKTHHPPW